MIVSLLWTACSPKTTLQERPIPIIETDVPISKGLDAYVTKLSVNIAKCDGVVDDLERKLIFKENGSGFDPILFHAVNTEQGQDFIAATKNQLHQQAARKGLGKEAAEWTFITVFERYLYKVALVDGKIKQTEQSAIDGYTKEIHRVKANGEKRSEQEVEIWAKGVKRGELSLVLNAIKNQELKYKQRHGSYVSFHEQPQRTSSQSPRTWTPLIEKDQQAFPLNIQSPILGSYWVTVNENGFEAYGVIDSDGDGVFATYMATSGANAEPLTENNIY